MIKYRILINLLTALAHLPLKVLYAFSDIAYFFIYHVIRYRRKTVRHNLEMVFGTADRERIIAIEKKFYRFFADMILESCKLASVSPEEIRRRMKFTNVEAVNSMLKQGKSVSVYLGHYGNWEWVSSMPLWLENGVTGAQIYHKLRNKDMERLMLHIRGRMGAVSVDMHKTSRYITGLVNSRQVCVVGFIADQSPRWQEARHFLPFLHHKTPVLTGTEKITKHYGFEAFYLDVKRLRRGYYEAEFTQLHGNPRALPDFELTTLYFRRLEQAILRQPELYLWTHNRFKHAERSDETV